MKTNLKQIRKEAGWSNADDFAAHVGIPAKTYRNYEQGIRKMGLDVACTICNALDCSIEDLLDTRREYAVVEADMENVPEVAEAELVACYRGMDRKHREMLLDMARSFASINEVDGK